MHVWPAFHGVALLGAHPQEQALPHVGMRTWGFRDVSHGQCSGSSLNAGHTCAYLSVA